MTDDAIPLDEWGSDLDVAEWLVWFARKVKGRSRDVAQRALDQYPALRFSERMAALSAPAGLDEWWTDGAMVNGGLPGDEHFVGDAATPDDAARIVEAHNAGRTP